MNSRKQAAKQAAAERSIEKKRRKEEDRFLQDAIYQYWHNELLKGWKVHDTTKRREDIIRFSAITGRTIKEAYEVVVQVYPIKAAEQVQCDA